MGILEGILGIIGGILQLVGFLLFKLYGWVVVVAILGYMIYQNRRREQFVSDIETVLLLIEVPRDNEKKELSAEQMFASLHGILHTKAELTREGIIQEHISFEIVARQNSIQFYVWCPKHLKDFVESQIYAQYPTVQIKEGPEDYATIKEGERAIYGTELSLTKSDVLPIRTFDTFEVDPLAGITGVLAKLEQAGEEVWIQILARPVDDTWQDKGKKYIDDVKNGRGTSGPLVNRIMSELFTLPNYIFGAFFQAILAPPTSKDAQKAEAKKVELSTSQQTEIKAVEEKLTKLGYDVKIRIAYLGPNDVLARQRMQAVVGGFKQFNTTNLNGFISEKTYATADFINDYRARLFLGKSQILNIAELASLYHLPHMSVETPNMAWTTSKTSAPPANLPVENPDVADEVSLFGLTNFRGKHLKFGLKRRDRGRHVYIIGQTGAGKSMLLQLITLSDVYHNEGFAIVDPHGDYATDIMKYIPEHRLKDVVYFNATDRDFPMAFNPMEVVDEHLKNHISSELVGVLKRMFVDSWGPRLEYILRYTILALLDYEGATMLDITRMLNEKDFRKKVVSNLKDPVVKNFWITEFAGWNDKFASEAVAPVLNKVGAFVANPLIRNIVGQPKSAFNIRKVMDEGKILIVNLSRGQVGEDNAAILGALMVTKIQLAAMSRADMPLDQRKPFYLYVDEFQNFATDSFAVILSEARKYGLNLTVANQYTSQMPDVVRDAVFGNVGTMITFRTGAEDSALLGKYYEPVFEALDITRLNNQNIFVSMIIDGEKVIPFSAKTLRMPDPEHDLTDQIVALSRRSYASNRVDVEEATRLNTEEPGRSAAPVDQGAQTLGQIAQPAFAPSNQKPNKPKSEFLASLTNPVAPAPSRTSGQGSGDQRNYRGQDANRQAGNRDSHDRRRYENREERPSAPRPAQSPAEPNRALREALAAAKAAQQMASQPAAAPQHAAVHEPSNHASESPARVVNLTPSAPQPATVSKQHTPPQRRPPQQ